MHAFMSKLLICKTAFNYFILFSSFNFLKIFFCEVFPVTTTAISGGNLLLVLETRLDTRLPKSRAGGQGPYLRSLDHLGRSSEVRE